MKNFIYKSLFLFFILTFFLSKGLYANFFATGEKLTTEKLPLDTFLKSEEKLLQKQSNSFIQENSQVDEELSFKKKFSWGLLRNCILSRSLQKALNLFDYIVDSFNNGNLFYNPEIEFLFFKISNSFAEIDEVKPRHLRSLRDKVIRFNKYLEKYVASRKRFLNEHDFNLINKIQKFNSLLINYLLKEDLLGLSFGDKFVDYVFCRPWEIICENKEIAISGLAAASAVGLYFLWSQITKLRRKIFPEKDNPGRRTIFFSNKGLKNKGNTCFMNSILQCLPDVSPLREAILKNLGKAQGADGTDDIAMECADLISKLRDAAIEEGSYDPESFVKNALTTILGKEYSVGTQEDAHEFLTKLLGRLVRTETTVSELITCDLVNSVKCQNCNRTSEKIDRGGLGVSVEIPESDNVKNLTKDCLNKFFGKEEFSGKNKYYCEKCKKKVDADKQLKLQKAPRVLIIQLKRFNYNKENKEEKKIKTSISFPTQNLDLKDFITQNDSDDNTKYDLIGIAFHRGRSLKGGHYISLSKDYRTKKWYKYNDSDVTQIEDMKIQEIASEGKYNSFNPYILFYQIQD